LYSSLKSQLRVGNTPILYRHPNPMHGNNIHTFYESYACPLEVSTWG
jgi:hypothetical protein